MTVPRRRLESPAKRPGEKERSPTSSSRVSPKPSLNAFLDING